MPFILRYRPVFEKQKKQNETIKQFKCCKQMFRLNQNKALRQTRSQTSKGYSNRAPKANRQNIKQTFKILNQTFKQTFKPVKQIDETIEVKKRVTDCSYIAAYDYDSMYMA